MLVVDAGALEFVEGTNEVMRIDPLTGEQTVISTDDLIVVPTAITVEKTGNILVSDASGFVGIGLGPSRILRIDPDSGQQAIVSSGGLLLDPRDLAVDRNGDILVAETDGFFGPEGFYASTPTQVPRRRSRRATCCPSRPESRYRDHRRSRSGSRDPR